MELRQLRYLLAVADESNFTRAAEKVFVSQSALSQQIQALEAEVGTVLLDRSKRGVRPTAGGAILIDHARRVFRELDMALVAIHELEGLNRGELRVGVVQTVNDYLMPSIAARFSEQHPQIRLYVEELSSDEIEAGLEAGNLQVGLSFVPATHPALDYEHVLDEELVLIVRDDHPLAGRESVPVKLLDALPMVMLSRSFCTRRLWEDSARLAAAEPQVVMEMNTVSSILSVIEHTGLASVLPKRTVAERRSPRLMSVDLCDPTPQRHVGVLWHRSSYLCRASRAFIDLMRSVS